MSNIDIMKKGLHAWENADEATLSPLVADDFQLSGPVPQPVGKAEFVGLMYVIHAGLPDFAFNACDFEENGDTVTVKSRITGTHTGMLTLPGLPPIPATGKKVDLPVEIQTATFKDGKLLRLTTDARPDAGIPGILAQIGVPLPPQ